MGSKLNIGKLVGRNSKKLLLWASRVAGGLELLARCWFQIFVIFTLIPGEMIQFKSYFSSGLVQPPTRKLRSALHGSNLAVQFSIGKLKMAPDS